MPLIWGYYHKWIKWAETFWRLALKPGFHSQMEQFQNALLVPWHMSKVCSTQVLVARTGRQRSTFNECVLGQPTPHYQQLLAGWKQRLYGTINQMKRCWFWNNKPGVVPRAPRLTLLKSGGDEHWADVLAGMCTTGSVALLALFLLQ